MSRRLPRLILCALLLALSACAGARTASDSASEETENTDHLAQLEALAPPKGVDQALWTALKQQLAVLISKGGGRTGSDAPLSQRSAARLTLDPGTLTLSWNYASQGDYDQNSETNISDLGPLGVHFGAASGGGAFPLGSLESVIDGNGDGEINISDLSPIGINFGRRVSEYHVYRSTDFGDVPTAPDGANGAGAELIGTVPFPEASGNASQEQLNFSFTLPDIRLGWFYWVRPADGASEGTASNVASFGGQPGNLVPLADLEAAPLSGPVPLSVNFDASGSSDPDGTAGNISDIVQFVWDFDGDGVIDETSAAPNTQHTYNSAGNFTATVTVFDSGASSSSASVQVSASSGNNAAPVAHITSFDSSGVAPFTASFSPNDSTDDGPLDELVAEWDFDSDGVFDQTTPAQSVLSIQHTYQQGGIFIATLRVRDAQGLSDTDQTTITVNDGTNQPPVAAVTSDVSSGDAPLTVTFDLSACSDPDSSLDLLLVDADGGDGDAETAFDPFPASIQLTFTTGGRFAVQFVVVDEFGASDTDTVDILVTVSGRQPPQASFTASPSSGNSPLAVTLDASTSTDDGSIEHYQWAFDGVPFLTGSFIDNGSNPVLVQDFSTGQHFATLRVVDDDGAVDYLRSVDINVSGGGNQPPTAALTVTRLTDSFPETFEFDASASDDPDGSITIYDWDFDGDGLTDLTTSTEDIVTHSFGAIQTANPKVRIFDDDLGSDTAAAPAIQVETGWQIDELSTQRNATSTSVIQVISGLSRRFQLAAGYSDSEALVSSASTDFSGGWSIPIKAFDDPVQSDFQQSPVRLLSVVKRPALLYPFHPATLGASAFQRADNLEGSSWPQGTPALCDALEPGPFDALLI